MKLPRNWTALQLAELDRRWLAGETTSIIGRAIGKTKNAVIGMSHRRRLPARPSPIREPAPLTPIFVVNPLPRPMCQWIDGVPTADDSCKCGAERLPGEVYCAHHKKISVCQPRRLRFSSANYSLITGAVR